MRRILFLLKISRPRFWIYVFGPFLVGSVAAAEHPNDLLTSNFWLFLPFFLFSANLLIYGINDIFDYETDVLNAKKQAYETLVVPDRRRELWIAISLANLPFLVATAFQGVLPILAMLAFLFFSIFYSAPPIRAKTKPLLDSAFNILYVFPAIFGYFLLGGVNLAWQICLAAAFWTMAMHAYSAVPDIESDLSAGLNTIATWLGGKKTLVFCLILYVLSGVLTFKYLGFLSLFASIAYAAMMIISLFGYSQERIFSVYRYFPMLNTIIGFALFWYIALSKFY